MGTRLLQSHLFTYPPTLFHLHHYARLLPDITTSTVFTRTLSCFAAYDGNRRYGGRSGGSSWKPEDKPRSGFDYEYDDEDDVEEFGSGNPAKQRIWWSDNSSWSRGSYYNSSNGYYSEDDEDGDDDAFGFGVLEESIGGFAWVSKVFRAFGWMLPAIVISMVLGTGPNAFVMALALPLAQSALSLVIDTLWGRSNDIPRSKPRTRKRPTARAATKPRMEKEKEQNAKAGEGAENYQSWVVADSDYVRKGNKSTRSFGGWDELDKKRRTAEIPRTAPFQKPELRQKKGKLSKRMRNRDTPLLTRLLIAVFPFLGSWMKLL